MVGFLAQIRKALSGDEAKMLALAYASLTRQGLTVNAAIAGNAGLSADADGCALVEVEGIIQGSPCTMPSDLRCAWILATILFRIVLLSFRRTVP